MIWDPSLIRGLIAAQNGETDTRLVSLVLDMKLEDTCQFGNGHGDPCRTVGDYRVRQKEDGYRSISKLVHRPDASFELELATITDAGIRMKAQSSFGEHQVTKSSLIEEFSR